MPCVAAAISAAKFFLNQPMPAFILSCEFMPAPPVNVGSVPRARRTAPLRENLSQVAFDDYRARAAGGTNDGLAVLARPSVTPRSRSWAPRARPAVRRRADRAPWR